MLLQLESSDLTRGRLEVTLQRKATVLRGKMMDLHEALSQISEIRHQMARTQVFRGYRSAPVAASGALALLAGLGQRCWIADPAQDVGTYLFLWIGAAIVSAAMSGAAIAARRRMDRSSYSREVTQLALEQFAPCLAAGGLVTIVIARSRPEWLAMLPGLWQILFAMGVFASCRLLPRATWCVGAFYLFTGLICLMLGEGALSPWAMAIPFGLGQVLAAGILYWNLERGHVEI